MACWAALGCERGPQDVVDPAPYSVWGTVSDSASLIPLAGATVLRSSILETTTDSTGSYQVLLGWVLLGTLEFTAGGYRSERFEIPELPEIATQEWQRSYRLDILLSRR
jgi:hypothetical protein